MKYPAHPLTRSQAAQLIEAARRGRQGVRNAAMLTVLYRTGLRATELAELRLADFYFDQGAAYVRVEKPKGLGRYAKPREVGLPSSAMDAVRAWLEVRGIAPGPLFCTGSGEKIQTSYLRQLLPRLGRRLGWERRIHPHALRHTFARELYDETKDMIVVMLALGHEKPETTVKYLRSIGATEVLAATQRRER